jgi:hypothetical protein
MAAVAGLAFGQPAGTTPRQDAPATSYSQIEAAVVKAGSDRSAPVLPERGDH